MNRDMILDYIEQSDVLQNLQQFAKIVAASERERCAQLCEDHFGSDGDWCARRIRELE